MEERGKTAADVPGNTILDVAEAAAVSVRTVSRVLNGSPKVNATTRATVQAVIERLGYSPSLRARAFALGRSYLIGLVHDDPNALVLDATQRGAVECCVERGYELIVHPTGHDRATIASEVASFVRRSRVDGVLVLSPVSEIAEIPTALAAMRIPSVGIASVRIPSYPAMLLSDERAGAHLVGEHLIELGHRRIGFVSGPRDFYSATEREQGFRKALRSGGIELPSAYVREGDYGFDSGVRAAEELLTMADRPSAIFASNDIMAAGVLNAAARLGMSIPRDVSVAGFDGSVLARMLSPTLTTVNRPLRDMARRATALLLDMIETSPKAAPSDLHAELSLHISGSTARCNLQS